MIFADTFDFYFDMARSFNEYVGAEQWPKNGAAHATNGTAAGGRPGDEFNARASWAEVLEPHGWRVTRSFGGRTYWLRPGKDGPGNSATTGFCKSEQRGDLLYVFSTNARPFETDQCYSKFEAHAQLNHGGNYAAAAADLAARGFGKQGEEIKFTRQTRGPKPSADNSDDPLDADATAADLIAAQTLITWLWEGWIPLGSLTILASEPGCGKTRFCADLLRRITGGLAWPDGTKHGLPSGTPCLWVAADNHHAELGSFPEPFGFPATVLCLNATKRDLYGGTMLDDKADLADLEARILRVRPAIVFIDTTTNATDRSAHKPEDAKAFFKPLQEIALRTKCAIVCVCHLNAAGKPLGRRIEGQGRVVIMLAKPDESQETRRRLWVRKTHSLVPAVLGVTMGTHGNEYDLNPPAFPEEGPAAKPRMSHLAEDCDWLAAYLAGGPKRVSYTRTDAETAGITAPRLYRAKDELEIEEYLTEGKKWWRLPSTPFDDEE